MELNLLIQFQQLLITNCWEVVLISNIEQKLSILLNSQDFLCNEFFNNFKCYRLSYSSMQVIHDINNRIGAILL